MHRTSILKDLAQYSTVLNATRNTFIILRSDHGLQDGPTRVDYSTQIEALRPWTEILVPKDLKAVSLATLFGNQQRLVTSADLYRTLTTLITSQDDEGMTLCLFVLCQRRTAHLLLLQCPLPNLKAKIKHSDWTINVLKDTIPPNRTCEDAKVFSDYCIYEQLRTFTAPNLGTCLLAEKHQKGRLTTHQESKTKNLRPHIQQK